jgi:hypothetical protein
MLAPTSRLRKRSHTRLPFTDSSLKTSSRPLRSRVALNSFAFTRSSASWPGHCRRQCAAYWDGCPRVSGRDDPKGILWYMPLGFLGVIRPHRRHEAWSASLWQTFFATCVGANIPAVHISQLSRSYQSRLVVAKILLWMFLAIMLAPVLPILELKRLTIGQSSNSLTYFV